MTKLDDIPQCPVFRPTLEEFKDFENYILKCEEQIENNSAIFKVVPPEGWVARKSGYDNLQKLTVKQPIEQNVNGNKGVYELVYFIKESKKLEVFKKSREQYDTLTNKKSLIEVERLFWKTLKLSSPVYGADVAASLFDEDAYWCLRKLDTLLNRMNIKGTIKGVNEPYVYIGSWKTMFGWHKEDMDLYSINYLHTGKSKFWYSVDLDCNDYFEEFAVQKFPESHN